MVDFDSIKDRLYSAVLSDALDAAGYREQCLQVALSPLTGVPRLAGRCRTTLWEDVEGIDPEPYALELEAVDDLQPGEILIAAAA